MPWKKPSPRQVDGCLPILELRSPGPCAALSGALTADMVDRSLAHLRDLPLTQDAIPSISNLQAPIELARQHLLRVADASYLELALRLEIPLATRDRKLAAAEKAGAKLFKP